MGTSGRRGVSQRRTLLFLCFLAVLLLSVLFRVASVPVVIPSGVPVRPSRPPTPPRTSAPTLSPHPTALHHAQPTNTSTPTHSPPVPDPTSQSPLPSSPPPDDTKQLTFFLSTWSGDKVGTERVPLLIASFARFANPAAIREMIIA
eukprot:Sspe_Gene.103955::Locus_79831_Transcript_1_1_Confidence_1.000_Length_503::g.103955::m.103955